MAFVPYIKTEADIIEHLTAFVAQLHRNQCSPADISAALRAVADAVPNIKHDPNAET